MANLAGGFHLSLDQFAEITDMIMAICCRQDTNLKLHLYEQEVQREGRMSRSLRRAFATMQGRDVVAETEPVDLHAVPAGCFQVLEVDTAMPIQEFARLNGLIFKADKGFYEFIKPETVQAHKEIVLQHRSAGDFLQEIRLASC